MRSMSTNKTRTIVTSAAALAVTAGLAVTTAGAASAATLPTKPLPRVAVGSVELGTPLQYQQFLALQGFGRNHGYVDYTNWTYADPGSGGLGACGGDDGGVSAPIPLIFTYQNSPYAHTLNGGLTLTALSPDKLAFSGTGSYPGITWKISGQANDSRFHATIAYDGLSYKVVMNGRIASNGSVSGTARSNQPQALTFTMPAGSFVSVLHYVAPIHSDQVQRHDATFQFTIPAGHVLAGTKVTVWVHDGGRGPAHDTDAHGVTGTTLYPYPIIGGPGVTVR